MAKEYAEKFYNSRAWRKTQKLFLMQKCYTCEDCGDSAVIVHHIRHITAININDPEITLNFENLRALCVACHNKTHWSGEACADGISFDDHGNVVFTPPLSDKNAAAPTPPAQLFRASP